MDYFVCILKGDTVVVDLFTPCENQNHGQTVIVNSLPQ